MSLVARKSTTSYLRLGGASSNQCTISSVRYQQAEYFQDVKICLVLWQGSSHQHIQTSATRLEGGHSYVEERRRKYGSLGKTVLQDTLSAHLVAEEYPTVSLANKDGDESDCCSALHSFLYFHHDPSLPDGVISSAQHSAGLQLILKC